MGGADFMPWHGNYPLLAITVELQSMAAELRQERGHARRCVSSMEAGRFSQS
jgi:hypothetical protein